MSGLGGRTGGAVVPSPVEVYDQKGRLVGVDILKKNDLLIVYWRKSMPHLNSITEDIQGTLYHSSLIVFDSIHNTQCFYGESVSSVNNTVPYVLCRWEEIEKIHLAGNDPSGRMLSFVREMDRQKNLLQSAADKMRRNIDALKA